MNVPRFEKFIFSNEEDEKLVAEMALQPALYDPRHKLYKDQGAKDDIWITIATELGRSVSDCKKRWKNIKDTYDRRQRWDSKSDAPPSKRAKKWALLKKLTFLQKVHDTRRSLRKNTVDAAEEDDDTTMHADEEDSSEQEKYPMTVSEPYEVPDCSFALPSQSINQPSAQNQNTSNFTEAVFMELESRAKDRVMANLVKPEEEADDIDLFFKSISKTVKTFPLQLKQRAKLETLALISKIEMEMWQ